MVREFWYKEAVIYALDVATFQDGNGDGIGDFKGLISRLDHIAGLGADTVWLHPFYPTPDRDGGYDIMDYYGLDPRLGTLGDFADFLHRARDRGLRVIADLVVNHTSDQHPWFQEARRDERSPFRDYYIWSRERPDGADDGMVFPGVEDSTWTWDDEAEAYYFHRFYSWQPDLNIWNPVVREEIRKIIGFWLDLGISGFRVDAAPFLVELKGSAPSDLEDRYQYLRELREFVSWRSGDAILLAEANVPMDEIPEYTGRGTKLQMLFNFVLNQQLFLALADEDARPIRQALAEIPKQPASVQLANFLRNHDELDLGRLSGEERSRVFEAFGADPDMQLYGRGIRRRLAPMFGNDARRMRLAYSLALTLPGTPVLRYGDEIGMGEDLSLPERMAVRTPMQWDDSRNGGFSGASPERLIRPAITDGEYGFEQLNVEAQRRDPDSMLNWMERAIRIRKECPEFGWGDVTVLDADDPSILAHASTFDGETVLAVHNLSSEPRSVSLHLEEVLEKEERSQPRPPPPPAGSQASVPLTASAPRQQAESGGWPGVDRRGDRRLAAEDSDRLREARDAAERERAGHRAAAIAERRRRVLHVVDLLGDRTYRPVEEGVPRVDLAGWGFRWLRLKRR